MPHGSYGCATWPSKLTEEEAECFLEWGDEEDILI